MTVTESVLDRAWELSPQVSVRPERFGALLYDFDTRRLSFLKDRRLLSVVEALPTAPTARQACVDAGVPAESMPAFDRAIARLAETHLIRPRETDSTELPGSGLDVRRDDVTSPAHVEKAAAR